ncbi:hypothetical protein [Edaphobacter aggregans]|uniref:hypothetical protein n=1 Tax=Edaphobacter aggregans TaxID=570835 RepID=UPI0005553664|nr:hypothetical protein [Edaphobacter aggregans]
MLKTASTFATIHTPSPFPASYKRYISGSRSDLRVPYREISLSPTRHGDRVEENPPLPVYDSSGPYMPVQELAVPSTPEIGKPFWYEAARFVAQDTA